jgi:hypothetical protein
MSTINHQSINAVITHTGTSNEYWQYTGVACLRIDVARTGCESVNETSRIGVKPKNAFHYIKASAGFTDVS